MSQCCSTLEPGYSWYMVSTNLWYGAVTLANLGKISQSSSVTVDELQNMPFHLSFVNFMGLYELKLEVLKNQWSSHGLVGLNYGAPHSPQVGIGGTIG